jgi:hypothetical protein
MKNLKGIMIVLTVLLIINGKLYKNENLLTFHIILVFILCLLNGCLNLKNKKNEKIRD